jgi:hypothetical protein
LLFFAFVDFATPNPLSSRTLEALVVFGITVSDSNATIALSTSTCGWESFVTCFSGSNSEILDS